MENKINVIKTQLFGDILLRRRTSAAIRKQKDLESSFATMGSCILMKLELVRFIRHYKSSQYSNVMEYLLKLNLSQYISDVVNAILEAKLEMIDVPSFKTVCICLHERYAGFASQFLEGWRKVILSLTNQKVWFTSKNELNRKCVSKSFF